jgi:hypothetical protein
MVNQATFIGHIAIHKKHLGEDKLEPSSGEDSGIDSMDAQKRRVHRVEKKKIIPNQLSNNKFASLGVHSGQTSFTTSSFCASSPLLSTISPKINLILIISIKINSLYQINNLCRISVLFSC